MGNKIILISEIFYLSHGVCCLQEKIDECLLMLQKKKVMDIEGILQGMKTSASSVLLEIVFR